MVKKNMGRAEEEEASVMQLSSLANWLVWGTRGGLDRPGTDSWSSRESSSPTPSWSSKLGGSS